MKHLIKYKLFESSDNIDIVDIYQNFIDDFEFKLISNTYNGISLGNSKVSFDISNSNLFGAKCLLIRMTDSNNNFISKKYHHNFDGIINQKFVDSLKDCHEHCLNYMSPVDVVIGSGGKYTTDFDIIYFKEKPDFSRFKDVEICGGQLYKKLDGITSTGIKYIGNLNSNYVRHPNIFSIDSELGSGIYSIMGYYDNWFYHDKDFMFLGSKDTLNPINKWVGGEWDKVCQKLNIKDREVIKDNPKIIVAEFMNILHNNQNNLVIYKK